MQKAVPMRRTEKKALKKGLYLKNLGFWAYGFTDKLLKVTIVEG